MAFTREELAAQEEAIKTPPVDKEDEQEEEEPNTEDDADPSGDELESDPDDQGDGTSDEEEDSSTSDDDADPSGETETDEEEEEDGKTVEPQPKKGSARERIQELVDERDGYRAFGEYAQEQIAARDQQVAELRAKLEAAGKSKTEIDAAVASESSEPMPTFEDEDVGYDPAKYQAKLNKWVETTVSTKVKAALKAAPAKTDEPEVPPEIKVFSERVNKFIEANKDFEAKVKTLPQLAQPAAKNIVLAEDGPAILYYLGNHVKDAVRIARLSPDEQLMELGAIRAALRRGKKTVIPPKPKDDPTPGQGAKTTAKTKSQSNAPTPPTRVVGGGRRDARDTTDPSMGMEEFARRHRQERVASREANRKARIGR